MRRASENAASRERLKNVDDELEIVIVKDMTLIGYDSPPLHTLYLDCPLKRALLMQTLARANRTLHGKQDGLLLAYAPLAVNLAKALADYTNTDQARKPMSRNVDDAVELTRSIVEELRTLLSCYGWKAVLQRGGPRAFRNDAIGAVNHLRDGTLIANQTEDDGESLAGRYRRLSGQLSRVWALCAGRIEELRAAIQFYEDVRVWMAKSDAEERQAHGEPIPTGILRMLAELLAKATASGEVVDIYSAAGMPRPSLDDLTA